VSDLPPIDWRNATLAFAKLADERTDALREIAEAPDEIPADALREIARQALL
jgi:hypothetical protein